MEQVQAEWLALFTRGQVKPEALATSGGGIGKDKVILSKDDERCRMLRDAELEKSIAVVDAAKKQLMDSLDMEFEVDGKKTKTKDAMGQQVNEADSEDARKITSDQDAKGAYSKAIAKANKNFAPLAQESARLRELTVKRHIFDGEGKDQKLVERTVALFEDVDIMKEFYTPLVRELIVPENFVPDRYSATKKMIDGSNDFYIEECKEKGAEPEIGLADFAKGVVNAASTAVQGAFPMYSDASEIIQGAALAIGAGIDGISLAKDSYDKGEIDISSWADIGDTVGNAVGQMAGGILDNANQGGVYGEMVTVGLRSFDFGARIGKWAANPKEDFPWDGLVNDILSAGGGIATGESDNTSDNTLGDNTGIVGASLTGFASALKSGVGQLKGLSLDSPPKDWAKAMTKVFAKAIAQGGDAFVNAESNIIENAGTYDNTGYNQINEEASAITGGIDKVEDWGEKGIDKAADKLFGKDETANDKKKKKEESQKQLDDAQSKIEAEKADFQRSLDSLGRTGDDGPTEEEFKSIAKLITKMQNDRMILKMASAVGNATAEVAGHFFAPLKAANSITSFIVNVHAACERANALLNWMDSNEDALTAVSPYATSIQNFVRNQGDQLTHHTVQAALNAAEAACAIAECGYPPVKAATMAISAATMLEKSIYDFANKQQLRKAWKITKEALENPANRKLGLIARKMNPTLAKYTIAYGAVIEKSPIAITAMSRCGLDRETLANPSSNVGQVKNYLQSLYEEDGVLLGPIPQGKNKTPLPRPSLSVKSWTMTVELWKDEHKLAGDPPAAVRLGLAELEKLDGIDQDKLEVEDKKKHLDSEVAALTGLEDAFNGYEPKDQAGLPLKGAPKVLSAYADLAGSRAVLTEEARDLLDKDTK